MTITIQLQVIWFIICFISATVLWIGLAVWLYKKDSKKDSQK